MEKTDDMMEINAFYDKYRPNPTVFKFQFRFEYLINGNLSYSLLYNLKPNDFININYRVDCLGKADYKDYMLFLL